MVTNDANLCELKYITVITMYKFTLTVLIYIVFNSVIISDRKFAAISYSHIFLLFASGRG